MIRLLAKSDELLDTEVTIHYYFTQHNALCIFSQNNGFIVTLLLLSVTYCS